MNAIEVSEVSKQFGNLTALDNVSLKVKEGEILGLLGPNGAGKTTLISIMTGLLSRDRGTMRILGKNADTSWREIKKQTNIISGFSAISPSMHVDEFLRYFSMLYDIPEREKRITEVMQLVELTEQKNQQVRDLSAGYKQRTLFAKALLNRPKLLYLDEPTVGLDLEISIKIKSLVKKLGQHGTTIIFTSHNMHEIEEICTSITLIMHGKILTQGTVNELKKKFKTYMRVQITCLDTKKAAASTKQYSKRSSIDGPTLTIDIEENDQQAVLDAVIRSGANLHSFTILEPTLEEVFLDLVRKK